MEQNRDTAKRYPDEFKESLVKRMLPPESISPTRLARECGVSKTSLRKWLNHAKGGNATKSKFKIVVETYSMNEVELSSYCRKNGCYVEEVKEWTRQFEQSESIRQIPDLRKEQAQSKEKIKKLERDLRRKEKALAETAALLVLSKKVEAIWGNSEEKEH